MSATGLARRGNVKLHPGNSHFDEEETPVREMYCATCQAETLFETPRCDDGHEDECPELVCTGCGTAVVAGPVTVRAWLRPRGAHIAPHQRRAA